MDEKIANNEIKKGGLVGFIDGEGYETALVTMKTYIQSLRWAYIYREVEDLKTLKTTLENSRIVLKTFNRIHKEMLDKYPADSIKELCLDYGLNKEKSDLIKVFKEAYKPLKHYVELRQAGLAF